VAEILKKKNQKFFPHFNAFSVLQLPWFEGIMFPDIQKRLDILPWSGAKASKFKDDWTSYLAY
jgi:hypothetical protein